MDYKKDADADDLAAIKLTCQHPLASVCDEEFAIMCRNLIHQHAKTMPTSQQMLQMYTVMTFLYCNTVIASKAVVVKPKEIYIQ